MTKGIDLTCSPSFPMFWVLIKVAEDRLLADFVAKVWGPAGINLFKVVQFRDRLRPQHGAARVARYKRLLIVTSCS